MFEKICHNLKTMLAPLTKHCLRLGLPDLSMHSRGVGSCFMTGGSPYTGGSRDTRSHEVRVTCQMQLDRAPRPRDGTGITYG